MAVTIETSESDRWHVLKVMHAEGMTFPEMLPVLFEHGLLVCQKDHRKRKGRDGATVCATCENTITVEWKRGLARLTETEADLLAVKGAWMDAHEFIDATCRRNIRVKRQATVTRTTEVVQMVEGKEVVTRNTVTTTSEEWRINVGLLKLLAEVRDKMARVGGMNVDRPAVGGTAPDIELHLHEIDGDSTGSADAPN